jgi:hypothetical protein
MSASVEAISSSQDAPPVCLWQEKPNRLVSLWDLMQPFQAHLFSHLSFVLGQMYQLTQTADADNGPSLGSVVAMKAAAKDVMQSCSYLGMKLSVIQLQEAETILDKAVADAIISSEARGWSFANRSIFDAAKRLKDDLSQTMLYAVQPDAAKYFGPAPFGDTVASAFKSSLRDIGDAGKCLAFGQGTACVFHLMRVMEVGLRSLGKSLNNPDLDPKRNPSWEAILKKCDDELAKPLKDRSSEWKADDLFNSKAIANLRAVKNAWRNPTMHVEINYEPDEAEDVFNAARGFMRHLSTKLHD